MPPRLRLRHRRPHDQLKEITAVFGLLQHQADTLKSAVGSAGRWEDQRIVMLAAEGLMRPGTLQPGIRLSHRIRGQYTHCQHMMRMEGPEARRW